MFLVLHVLPVVAPAFIPCISPSLVPFAAFIDAPSFVLFVVSFQVLFALSVASDFPSWTLCTVVKKEGSLTETAVTWETVGLATGDRSVQCELQSIKQVLGLIFGHSHAKCAVLDQCHGAVCDFFNVTALTVTSLETPMKRSLGANQIESNPAI